MAKRKFNKNKIIKLTAKQIEISIADYFCPRRNLVVPNVYWGLNFVYELDILVVTQSNYAYEIEIKTTISDIKADKKKRKFVEFASVTRNGKVTWDGKPVGYQLPHTIITGRKGK